MLSFASQVLYRPERLTLLEKASRLSFSGCRGIFFFMPLSQMPATLLIPLLGGEG